MNSNESIKIGKHIFKVLFPDTPSNTTEEEDKALKDDIAKNGVRIPIIVDQFMNIIDGVRRARICSELGLKDIPFIIMVNLTDQEKQEIAITLNANRRNWTKEDKHQIAVSLRKAKFSLRRISEVLGVGSETVRRWLNVSGETEEFPDKVIGKDGVERPAKRKAIILARSVNEAKRLSDRLKESDVTENLGAKIIYGSHLDRELNKARQKNPPDDIPHETIIGDAELYLGDFRQECERIADNSVNIIFTDPPYGEISLALYEYLAELASRILTPCGLLLSYAGNMYIPTIHKIFSESLEYVWTLAVRHTGGNTPIHNVKVFQSYKPIVCYQKPPRNIYWTPFVDMISGGKSKTFHKWEQPESEAEHFLKAFCTEKGQTLCDPMMGSGSIILAGLNLGVGLKCIGVDIDPQAYATAKQRVEQLVNSLKADVA